MVRCFGRCRGSQLNRSVMSRDRLGPSLPLSSPDASLRGPIEGRKLKWFTAVAALDFVLETKQPHWPTSQTPAFHLAAAGVTEAHGQPNTKRADRLMQPDD